VLSYREAHKAWVRDAAGLCFRTSPCCGGINESKGALVLVAMGVDSDAVTEVTQASQVPAGDPIGLSAK